MKSLVILLLFILLAGCLTQPEAKKDTESSQSVQEQRQSAQERNQAPQSVQEQKREPAASAEKQTKVVLDVPLVSQKPELKYGCEVSSLAMVLKHAGVPANKLKLANEVKKDNDPLRVDKNGNITHWGDPNDGFVGDMTGQTKGYAVYAAPLAELMERYLPGRVVNLTKRPFNELLKQVKEGKPVVVWTTGDYKLPDRWESWKHGNEKIETPLDLHAVVLVGFDADHVYVNDPLSVKKAHKVDKQTFEKSWTALGQQALSYR